MPDAAPSGRAMLPREFDSGSRDRGPASRLAEASGRNRRLAVDELSLRRAPLGLSARLISALTKVTNMAYRRRRRPSGSRPSRMH